MLIKLEYVVMTTHYYVDQTSVNKLFEGVNNTIYLHTKLMYMYANFYAGVVDSCH